MKFIVAAFISVAVFLSQAGVSSFSASKPLAKRAKLGKGTWVDCKKFHRPGPVLIRVDGKGKWLCWTGKETSS
jgi:hypothetical protein